MTISSTTNRVEATGNGTTTSFSFPYSVLAAADLKVYQNGTLKTITTHYTLSGSAPYTSGTNVQFVTAPAANDDIVILRDPAITQLTELVENDPLPVKAGVERPLDKLTMIAQRLDDRLDRSFILADTDVSGASTVIPTPAANKVLSWNSAGDALINVDAEDLATVALSESKIVDLFVAVTHFTAGTTTQLTLSQTPGAEENIAITFDGVVQHHNTYSVSGTVVTFTAAIPIGTLEVEAQYTRTLTVNTAASENVTFVQAGTGATTRNARDKMREIVSVKDFGAIGDGVIDDMAAIQAAYDSLTSGGTVYFSPGTYKITGQITVAYAITTIGAGRGNTIIRATTLGTNKAAFKATVDNCYFIGFTLRGPSSAAYVAEEQGIYLYGTSGAIKSSGGVRDVEVYNFGNAGILAEYYNDVRTEACRVHDCGYVGIGGWSVDDFVACENVVATITPGTASNAYGIVISNRASEAVSKRFTIANNTINDITLWEGIDTHGGTDGTIIGNVITNCKLGINVSPGDGHNLPPKRIAIVGNTVNRGAATAFRAIGSGGTTANIADGITVVGNTIINMGVAADYIEGAIMFQFTKGLVISGNAIFDPVATGIGIKGDNTDFVVTGNAIAVVQAGHANASGIVINGAGQTGLISGNLIETVAGQFGIFDNGGSTGILVTANKIAASGSSFVNPPPGSEFVGTATYDPANLADGAGVTTTVTAVGAALGDYVTATFSLDLQGITLTAWVSAVNTVSVRFQNESGGALDLGSGTLRVKVTKA